MRYRPLSALVPSLHAVRRPRCSHPMIPASQPARESFRGIAKSASFATRVCGCAPVCICLHTVALPWHALSHARQNGPSRDSRLKTFRRASLPLGPQGPSLEPPALPGNVADPADQTLPVDALFPFTAKNRPPPTSTGFPPGERKRRRRNQASNLSPAGQGAAFGRNRRAPAASRLASSITLPGDKPLKNFKPIFAASAGNLNSAARRTPQSTLNFVPSGKRRKTLQSLTPTRPAHAPHAPISQTHTARSAAGRRAYMLNAGVSPPTTPPSVRKDPLANLPALTPQPAPGAPSTAPRCSKAPPANPPIGHLCPTQVGNVIRCATSGQSGRESRRTCPGRGGKGAKRKWDTDSTTSR